jgi:hypothetical protein
MDEYNKGGRGRPDPMLGDLEEESSLYSHDSRDANDFQLDLLDYSDDDSGHQSSEDELTSEEEETPEESEPFASEEIMELLAARHELGHVLSDDSHFSKVDSTVDRGETTSERSPVTTSATIKEGVGKKSGEKSTGKRRRQNSTISADLNAGRCVFFSIDLEHGGDKAGILQLSVEAFTRDGERLGEPFNLHVKPPAGSSIPTAMTDVHGLSVSDPRIKSASGILDVWPKFKQYIESKLGNGAKKGIMVAWGGKACDCEWLFRVTEVDHRGELSMPQGLDFFLDPCFVISHYSSCKLNNVHTGLTGYGLEMTWCHINGCDRLPDAHSSLADCRAQTDVVLHQEFLPFIDKSFSIVRMEEVWAKKRKKAKKQQEELTRAVPDGWTEDGTTSWTPSWNRSYKGPEGGGECGPSTHAKAAVANRNGINPLVNLFLSLWSLDLLTTTATFTEKYGRGDWVKKSARNDAAGKERKRPILVPCNPDDPDRRHRHTDENSWKEVTVGFILAFLSILMLRGVYGIRCATMFWESPPRGIYVPFVQNLMPRNNYLQIRRYLHFVDNESLPKLPGDKNWHPLQKIKPVLDIVRSRMQIAWTLGQNIVIDESMILYNGRAIQWVQYMPRKPIKHGIKVFALCCATTGVLVSFLVYTGKDYVPPGESWSNINVCDILLNSAGLRSVGVGRVLYTDNFYTSISLREHCYAVYGFLMVGTYALSSKLSRTARDFPFHMDGPVVPLSHWVQIALS